MPAFCCLNGKIIPTKDAGVNVYDTGLLRGFGIYEALMTYNRSPFRLDDHLNRFRRSAAELVLKIPAADAEITSVIHELIKRNISEGKEAVIRFILTGGQAIGGIEYEFERPTFYILVEEFNLLDALYYTRGCSLTLYEHQRQFPECKTTNYIQAVLLQNERRQAGALEILYTSKGTVLECATSNFFIVKSGVIATAKEGILEGITRRVVIELATPHYRLEERPISVDEMFAADEAFLTSSFKDVVPVVKVGGRGIGDGTVGPVSKRVMELFHGYTHAYGLASFSSRDARAMMSN